MITQQPQSQVVTQGENASFSVVASGTAPLSYQWNLNGTPVVGATNASLALTNVQATDAGGYTVVVTNLGGSITSAVATLTVLVPPVITTPPQSQTVIQGQNASFWVVASGTAPLSYQWNINGTPLVGATNASLALTNVQATDAGGYTVVVTNLGGSITSAVAALTVLVPPGITTPPQSQTVIQGQDASFWVVASGTAPLSYQWNLNSTPLVGATNASLGLTNVQATDAGGYTVVVTNLGGSITSAVATLTVLVPPGITTPPQSQTVIQGQDASFWVVASGTAPLSYQWNINGTLLVGATNASLAFTNVQATDAGGYTVVVTNLGGSITSAVATLTVLVPPGITTPPQSQTVTQGQNASFWVVASGTAPLSYQWNINGTPVVGATNASLALTNVQATDAGSCTVVVTNAAGSVTSAVATLTVLVPPGITTEPQNQTVTQGQTASFWVVASGTAPLSYQWNLNGTPLVGATNASLALTNVQATDAGSYTVVVTNLGGSITSAVATLTVLVPPGITTPPQSQTVTQGQNASFWVVASGTAPLGYQWSFNGTPVVGATNASLALTNVQATDAGSCTVVVTNAAGSVTSAVATLTVLVPPGITTPPQSQTVTQGQTASFWVVASGTAPLSYQWNLNGTPVVGATNASLAFTNVQATDAGSCAVVVTNAAGSVTSAVATLTVLVPPGITTQPQSQVVTQGQTASFWVVASGTAPLSYQWNLNGTPLVGASNVSLALTNVQATDAGSCTVVVTNLGGSITSAVATLTVLVPPGITTPPQSQTVIQGQDASFWVVASGTAPLSYQWNLNGTPLVGATNASLALTNVQATDAGSCTVVVTNAAGSVTSAVATLTVLVPPGITTPPQSQAVTQGQNASFWVVASGTAPLGYQWSLNGTALSSATSSTLTLNNVQTTDAGSCTVVVTNAAGSVTSAVATLTVLTYVPDSNLAAAMGCALPPPQLLTPSAVAGLTCLSARNRQIKDLTGLGWATNLETLILSENLLSDLSVLTNLTQLRRLEIDKNGGNITTLAPLAGLTNLECLVLGGIHPTNYWVLSGLTNLSSLTVRAGGLIDLTVLTNLADLSSLVLWQDGIQDVSPLAGLTNLSRLDLRWNSITNVSAILPSLTNLTSLYLAGNWLSNVPPVQTLNSLTLLNLDQNQIADLSPLTGLRNLTYLSLSVNPIGNPQVLSNLTGLINLELHGNAISNVDFMASLGQLNYADLAYNSISNLAPLANLRRLTSLVLAGNPVSDYSPLYGMTNLVNLWLHDNTITNAQFLTQLPWLNHLNLDHNQITDLTFLSAFTNLTGLGLSRNPIADYSPLGAAAFTNLNSLRLEGDCLNETDVASFIAPFQALAFLSLNHNRIADLTPVASLNGLQELYLRRNQIHDPGPLANLPQLLEVDLSGNGLNLNDPATSTALAALQCSRTGMVPCGCGLATNLAQGSLCQCIHVIVAPQSAAPQLSLGFTPRGFPAGSPWPVLSGATSSLPITASDGLVPDGLLPCTPLLVFAASDNPAVVSVPTDTLPDSYDQYRVNPSTPYTLNATGGEASSSAVTITLTVTNEVGLSSSTNFTLSVVPADYGTNCVSTLCTNMDSKLLASLLVAAGEPNGCLTPLDLLRLPGLSVSGADVSDSCAWQWLTNLTSLYLPGNSISNLDFLTNQTQLTSLSLEGNRITDISALAGLTNLSYLNLGWNLITNFDEFLSGFASVTSLDLGGNSISNVEFLTNLTQLTTLGLEDNRITDLSPLDALTNLIWLTVQQNLLTNVSSLTDLSRLRSVDLRVNLLEVSSGSDTAAAIQQLRAQGASVYYQPQREPPIITAPGFWFVSINATSFLSFKITDNALYGSQFSVQAVSSDTNLVSNGSALIWGPDANGNWTLALTPAANQTGTVNVTLVATDDAGLSSDANIQVSVMDPQVADIPDTNLLAAILKMLGDPAGYVTDVDLLNLAELDIYGAGISNLSGLQGAVNVTTLHLDGNSISDLGPLSNLVRMTSLSLSNNFVTDISPLAGLTNLTYLNVAWNLITNYEPFLSGFSNLTSLDLGGNCISNVTFLQNLPQLLALGLENNWISDFSPLVGLTNLKYLNLQNNLLTNILALTNLTQLSRVDVSFNYLDTTSSSATTSTIQSLQGQGVTVYYLPQRAPPLPLDDPFFGTANLMWQTGGDARWFGQTNVALEGIPAAQSGAIGNRRESWLEATVTGPGALSFWWKVSSQTNHDFLTFSIDTNEQARISGEVDWQQQVYALSPGLHALLWDYSKDLDTSSGLDAGWLARVAFQPPVQLVLTAGPTNLQLTVLGVPGAAYQIQTSTNLVDWAVLATGVSTNTMMVYDVGPAAGACFYRIQALNP